MFGFHNLKNADATVCLFFVSSRSNAFFVLSNGTGLQVCLLGYFILTFLSLTLAHAAE